MKVVLIIHCLGDQNTFNLHERYGNDVLRHLHEQLITCMDDIKCLSVLGGGGEASAWSSVD